MILTFFIFYLSIYLFLSTKTTTTIQEDYVKYCASYAIEHCADDLHYFEHEYPMGEKGLKDRLLNVIHNEFAQITYTDAVALLQKEIKEGKVTFTAYPNWGDDLGSEHERYITEKVIVDVDN
jgi:asparaginyl-tRNA synthetase